MVVLGSRGDDGMDELVAAWLKDGWLEGRMCWVGDGATGGGPICPICVVVFVVWECAVDVWLADVRLGVA